MKLVYVSCLILREGEKMPEAGNLDNLRKHASEELDEEVCCSSLRQGILFRRLPTNIDVNQAGTLLVTPKAASFMFFHDLPEAESQHWSSLLRPHSLGAMWSTQSSAAWRDIPSTYVMCNRGRVMPVQKQEEMIKHAKEVQPKAFDSVERLESGHEPILSKIDDLVMIMMERATKGKEVW